LPLKIRATIKDCPYKINKPRAKVRFLLKKSKALEMFSSFERYLPFGAC